MAPLSTREKFDLFLKGTYGPLSLAGSAASAGYRQWIDSPSEWGQGAAGYGRRFASGMGRKTIKHSVEFGLGAALGEDPRYFPSEKGGILPRVWHAVAHTFVVRTDSGGRTFAFSRVAGALTSGFVANTWYPDRLSNTSHALTRSGTTISLDAAKNVFHEFWPDIKRALRRR